MPSGERPDDGRAVRELGDGDWNRWDAYVRSHPHGTVFHTTGWLRALGDRARVLVDEEAGEIRGGIALASTKRYGVAGYHILPYTPYGGPLFGSGSTGYACEGSGYNAFIRDILAAVGNAGHVDFVLPSTDPDLLPYKWAGFDVGIAITYQIAGGGEPLLRRIASGTRGQVKKLLRLLASGEITARWDDGRDAILELQAGLARRKSFDHHGRGLARLLEKTEPGTFRSLLLTGERFGDLAGCICAVDEKRYYNLIAATRGDLAGDYRQIGALMYYLMIGDALESNRTFDFEGSSIPGVARFYRQMGGEQVPTYRLQKTRSPYYAALRFLKTLRAARSS
jgi:hypothetical protein